MMMMMFRSMIDGGITVEIRQFHCSSIYNIIPCCSYHLYGELEYCFWKGVSRSWKMQWFPYIDKNICARLYDRYHRYYTSCPTRHGDDAL